MIEKPLVSNKKIINLVGDLYIILTVRIRKYVQAHFDISLPGLQTIGNGWRSSIPA